MIHKKEIYECIYNIELVSNTIQAAKNQHKALKLKTGDPLDADMMFYSYVKICSILEEFKILRDLAGEDAYLDKVMQSLSPVIRYVSNYKADFNGVRNTLVAHFGRKSNLEFKPFWKELTKWNVPRSMGELEYIYDILDFAKAKLIERFSTGYMEFQTSISTEMGLALAIFANKHQPKPALDIETIKNEVEQLLTKSGV